MLLVVIIVLLIIGILGLIAYDNDWFKYGWINDAMLNIGATITIAATIGIIGSGIVFGVNYLGVDGYVEKCNKCYETLVFQVENNFYKDDVTTRELVKEIQEWNCDLAKNKINQYSPWIGIYIPDIYDQFEFISLDNLVEPNQSGGKI